MSRDKKVLVLGIDGMDSRITKKFLDEGKLPNIKKYLERGAARTGLDMLGAIPTITPPCWTTLATGAYPGTHGITCYWRQSPDSLDAVVYNMDSRFCKAEQLWNVTAKEGKKTLVWHWPGSSWPPSLKSENLHVVDGTQPGSVNMGIAQMDWEKVVIASTRIKKAEYLPKVERKQGVGCVIDDLSALQAGDEDDEMMELWWGDEAREGKEIRTYVHDLDDTEMMIGAKVAYDMVSSPVVPAEGWKQAPGKRVVGIAMRNKDSVVLGLGGAECGDIVFTINEGFNRLHGDGLSTAEGYAQTSVTPVFLAAGEDIKEGTITDRVIRQVDVAPTIAEILGVRKPEQCEGAPVYQILKK